MEYGVLPYDWQANLPGDHRATSHLARRMRITVLNRIRLHCLGWEISHWKKPRVNSIGRSCWRPGSREVSRENQYWSLLTICPEIYNFTEGRKERLHTDSVVNKVPDNPLILHTYPSQAPAGAMDPKMNQVLKSNSNDSQTWKRFSAEQAPWFDLEDLNFCIFHCSAKTKLTLLTWPR